MDQEKFGALIKEIRKRNNLTQKDLADKYNVTYQAVSKWENAKNMPDIELIKQISKDFNVSLDIMLDNDIEKNNKKKIVIIIGLIMVILLSILVFLLIFNKKDFEFKTLSSNCDNFTISGSIAYNDKKASIYITNIRYCGGNDTKLYKEIECILYESDNTLEKKISSYKYSEKNILLEDFLKDVTLTISDYKQVCNIHFSNSLYLLINAKDSNDKITSYKIPLTLEDNCN